MEETAIAMSCNTLSSAYDRLGASHAVSYLISTSTVGSRYHPLQMRESRFREVAEPASHSIMKWWGQHVTNPAHLQSLCSSYHTGVLQSLPVCLIFELETFLLWF